MKIDYSKGRAAKALIFCCPLLVSFIPVLAAAANIQLPSYANSGNLSSNLESTGGAITKVLISIAVMVGIGGIVWSGVCFSTGDGDKGKRLLGYSVVGLIIVAVAGGIAAIAIGTAK